MPSERYNPLSRYLKERFGMRVRKVTIVCGFTCPNRDGKKGTGGCIYCEPKTLTPAGYKEGLSVTGQIERGIERVKKRYGAEGFIAYFQVNTNTYGEAGLLESLYREAISHPEVVALAISTRPDCVDSNVLELLAGLKKEKHLWLEMGLQSSNDTTLEFINRGHKAEDFREAVLMAQKKAIDVCAHVIFGLPGEAKKDMLSTVRFISELPIWGIKFHQLDIVRGTALEEMYGRGGFKILSLEEYAEIVVESLELLSPRVTIHRLSGTTPEGLLVAPHWGLDKLRVKAGIERLLLKKDTRQGARWQR